MIQYDYHGEQNQQFRLVPVGENDGGNSRDAPARDYSGTYYIVSKNGAAVHTSNAGTADRTNIVLWDSYAKNAPQAQWTFARQSDGTYFITNVKSGKVLDVPNFAKASGTELIIFSRNGGANQKWRVEKNGDGYVSIISVSSGLAVDVPGYSNQNWTKLVQNNYSGGKEQQFRLVPVN